MRNFAMFLMIAMYIQVVYWLYQTKQYPMATALFLAVLLGELASIKLTGRTMSAIFVETLWRSPAAKPIGVVILVLVNLFGLHLLGFF